MKTFYNRLVIALFFSIIINVSTGFAALKNWTGNSNSNWNDPLNWSGLTLPLNNDDIFINPVFYTGLSASPVIATSSLFQPTNLTILNGGVLIVESSLGVSGLVTLNGNSLIEINNSGVLNLYSSLSLLTTSDKIIQSGGQIIFNNTAIWTNAGIYLASGGEAIFNGNTTITNSSASFTFYDLVIKPGCTLIHDNSISNINVTMNWINEGGSFVPNLQTVTFNGITSQLISSQSSENFYNLTINNISPIIPQLSLQGNLSISNTLKMQSGCVNQSSNTVTLGTSVTNIGILDHTSGWLYGGNFTRWTTPNNYAAMDPKGHYPIGSMFHYRPFWLSISANLKTGGTFTLYHEAYYPSIVIPANHLDPGFGPFPGTIIEGVSQSSWNVSTGDGLEHNKTSKFHLKYGGYGFGVFNLADLSSTLISSVVGNHAAASSGTVPLEVNRNNVYRPDLDNNYTVQKFRIGTGDTVYSYLPIALVEFKANVKNQSVALTWTTASETNSDHYIVEKTKDGKEFFEVAGLDAGGNTNEYRHYEINDDAPLPGTSYYRLKQVDYDGTINLSELVAVNLPVTIAPFEIFPNPLMNGQTATMQISGSKNQEILIVVMDELGREHYSKTVLMKDDEQIVVIDVLKRLSPGLYFVTGSGENFMHHKKIMVLE